MWNKVLVLAAGILAMVVLISGIMTAVNADSATTAGAAAVGAPPGPPPGGHPGGNILGRVAQILNIDQQKLEDAFKQAESEGQQQRTNDMFAKLVTDGKLTQAQADQYKAWLAARPQGAPGFPMFDAAKSTDFLDKLLKDGKITQAQVDAYKTWIAQKPAFELPKPERPAGAPSDNRTWRGGPPCPGGSSK